MADAFWYVVMVPMVYLAAAWCLVWIAVKIMRTLKAPALPFTTRIFPEGKTSADPPESPLLGAFYDAFTMPGIRRTKPMFWVFLMLFHTTLVLLILSHLDMLPRIDLTDPQSAHMLGHGAIGLLFTLSVLYFMFRRFRTPVREVSVPSDFLILFILLCAAVSGDIISWGNSWTESGFVMTKQDFGLYLNSLLTFSFEDPKKFLSGGHYSVIGTHVLAANLFLLVLPFSKIMHFVFVVPLNKIRRG
jgi:nitrate reductase gamma subunit